MFFHSPMPARIRYNAFAYDRYYCLQNWAKSL